MRQGVPVARVVELRLGSSRALMSQMRVLRWIRPPSVALLTVARLLSAIHGRLLSRQTTNPLPAHYCRVLQRAIPAPVSLSA